MIKILGGLFLLAALFSTSASAATLKNDPLFAARMSPAQFVVSQSTVHHQTPLIDVNDIVTLQTHMQILLAKQSDTLFDRDDINAVVYMFSHATLPRRGRYFRIHNGGAAFPYQKLPDTANLYLFHKLQAYRYTLNPKRIPQIANLAIRMEWRDAIFRL